jgi:hypothetical protein
MKPYMSPIFQKLNFKDHTAIWVIDAPASFQPSLDEMRAIIAIRDDLAKAKDIAFALAFATTKSEVDKFVGRIAKAAIGDAIVWVAYPKGTSKRYKCEFNRDNGWDQFAANGFESVRMVAIDEDWCALRFRRVEYVKTKRAPAGA